MTKNAGSKWNRFFKIFGTSTLAAAMAVSLTGCGTTTTAKPNSLVVWGFIDEDAMKPIIKDFMTQNKGTTVKYYKKTLDGNYEDNALNSMLSGQGPDVWAIPNDWVYRHKDKLTTASDTLLKNTKFVPKNYFIPSVINDCVFDNKLYAMTPTVDVLHVYYNQRLFDQSLERAKITLKNNPTEKTRVTKLLSQFPVTWGNFDAMIPWLTTKNGNTISVGGAAIGTANNVSHGADILAALMLQNQTKMISDDLTQATFNLPVKNSNGNDSYSGKSSLDFYTKYANPSNPDYTWNASMPNDVNAFANEKVAVIFSYTDLTGYFSQLYPKFSYKRALMPQIGELNPIIDYSKYTAYTVPTTSVNSSLSWNFVYHLSITSASNYRYTTKELTSRKSSETPNLLLKDRGAVSPPNNVTAQSITTWNKGRYPSDVDAEFKDAIGRVVSGAQNSQASLDTAASNVTTLLRKTTW